jgi:hypothetical protein
MTFGMWLLLSQTSQVLSLNAKAGAGYWSNLYVDGAGPGTWGGPFPRKCCPCQYTADACSEMFNRLVSFLLVLNQTFSQNFCLEIQKLRIHDTPESWNYQPVDCWCTSKWILTRRSAALILWRNRLQSSITNAWNDTWPCWKCTKSLACLFTAGRINCFLLISQPVNIWRWTDSAASSQITTKLGLRLLTAKLVLKWRTYQTRCHRTSSCNKGSDWCEWHR